MKQLTVLVLFAIFGLGLVGASRGQDTAPAPTTAAKPAPTEPAKSEVVTGVVMQKTPYFDPQLAIVGLLAVNSVLFVLGLGQLFGIKASLDKIASK